MLLCFFAATWVAAALSPRPRARASARTRHAQHAAYAWSLASALDMGEPGFSSIGGRAWSYIHCARKTLPGACDVMPQVTMPCAGAVVQLTDGRDPHQPIVGEVRYALERAPSCCPSPCYVLRAVLGWSGHRLLPLTRPCGARVASQLRDDEKDDERERDDEDGTRAERVRPEPRCLASASPEARRGPPWPGPHVA